MLTTEQVTKVADALGAGQGLKAALLDVTGAEPSIQLLTWLKNNHYELLTDAKHGQGHASAQAALREAQLHG